MSEKNTSISDKQEADETRSRLLDAALAIFAETGFDGASVRQICDRAGVRNIGAINYHFQSKERLYAETVKQAFCMDAEGLPLPQWSEDTPPADKLSDFIHV